MNRIFQNENIEILLQLLGEQDTLQKLYKNFPLHYFKNSQQKCKQLKKGDMILIQTPGIRYSLMRIIFKSNYDHLLLVLNDEFSLNICFPTIKLIPNEIIMLEYCSPIVIRANLNDQIIQQVIIDAYKLVGKKYDFAKLMFLLLQKRLKSFKFSKNIFSKVSNEERFICTDGIINLFLKHSKEISQSIEKNLKYNTDFQQINAYSPNDILTLAKRDQEFFQIIYPYGTYIYNDAQPIIQSQYRNQIKKFLNFEFKSDDFKIIKILYFAFRLYNLKNKIKNTKSKGKKIFYYIQLANYIQRILHNIEETVEYLQQLIEDQKLFQNMLEKKIQSKL